MSNYDALEVFKVPLNMISDREVVLSFRGYGNFI